jgi:hypothetical protein
VREHILAELVGRVRLRPERVVEVAVRAAALRGPAQVVADRIRAGILAEPRERPVRLDEVRAELCIAPVVGFLTRITIVLSPSIVPSVFVPSSCSLSCTAP